MPPGPRSASLPQAGTGPATRQGRGRHSSGEPGAYQIPRQGAAGPGPAGPGSTAGPGSLGLGGPGPGSAGAPPRRGPAHGYPPRAGDPGPRYPQGQFAAWNESAAPTREAPVQDTSEWLAAQPVQSTSEWMAAQPVQDTSEWMATRPAQDSPDWLADQPAQNTAEWMAAQPVQSTSEWMAARSAQDSPDWLADQSAQSTSEWMAQQWLARADQDTPTRPGQQRPDRTGPETLDRMAGELPMASAPTWADTGDATTWPPADEFGAEPGGGVALAERPDDLDGYSDEDVEEVAAGFARATAIAVDEPVITGVDERGAGRAIGGIRTAAGRSRAAAAKARKTARRKGRTRRRVVVAGISVPAVAAVAFLVMHHPGAAPQHSTPPAHAPASAAASSPTQNLGPWQHIGTRAEDPAPLTLSQLFPAGFSVGGASYARTIQLASTDCTSAVFGSRLQSAVHKYGCSQVMRASYLSTGQKLMGTIGVVNLSTSTGASDVGKVTGPSEFIAQLAAPSGPTHDLTKGLGLEEAEVKGHYLILTWVEFTNLQAPKTNAEKTELRTFSANLIGQTANVSLTSRMVTGNPQVP
jgi:hypothetical protein